MLITQMKIDFWILWCALLVGMGFGFTMLNNMSQIVESLGGGERLTLPVHVLSASAGCPLYRHAWTTQIP